MARVLYSPTITELRGSIGGVTFQRNSSGAIAKLKNSQKFSLSSIQSNSSSNLSYVSSLWSTLDSGQQNTWNAFAAAHSRTDYYGRIKNLSGFQWFLSCNLNLLSVAEPLLSSAPAYVAPEILVSPAAYPSGSAFIAEWGASAPASGSSIVIMATPPTGSNSLLSRVQQRLISVYKGSPVTSLDLTAEYLSAFGIDWATFTDSNRVFIQSQIFTVALPSGISSPYQGQISEWP